MEKIAKEEYIKVVEQEEAEERESAARTGQTNRGNVDERKHAGILPSFLKYHRNSVHSYHRATTEGMAAKKNERCKN